MIEGFTFLVEFENEESFQSFFEMYGGQEDIHITDLEDETIKKKITIYKRVKDVPIFSSRNLKSKKRELFIEAPTTVSVKFHKFQSTRS